MFINQQVKKYKERYLINVTESMEGCHRFKGCRGGSTLEVDLRVAVLLLVSALIILTYVSSVSLAEPDQPPTRICFTFPMPLRKKLGTYDLFLLPDTTFYLVPGAQWCP